MVNKLAACWGSNVSAAATVRSFVRFNERVVSLLVVRELVVLVSLSVGRRQILVILKLSLNFSWLT